MKNKSLLLFLSCIGILYFFLFKSFPYINDDEYYPIVMAQKYLNFENFSMFGMTYYTSSLFNFTLIPFQTIFEDKIIASRLMNLIFFLASLFLTFQIHKSYKSLLLLVFTPTFFFFTINSLEAIGLLTFLIMLGIFFLEKKVKLSSIFFGLASQLHVVALPALWLFFKDKKLNKENSKRFCVFLLPTIILNCYKIPIFFENSQAIHFKLIDHFLFFSSILEGSLFYKVLSQQTNIPYLGIVLFFVVLIILRKTKFVLIGLLIFLSIIFITPEFPRITYWCFYFFIFHHLLMNELPKNKFNILFAITLISYVFYSAKSLNQLQNWPMNVKDTYIYSEFLPHRTINVKNLTDYILSEKFESIITNEPNLEILVPYTVYLKVVKVPDLHIDTTNENKWRFRQYKIKSERYKGKTLYLSTNSNCPDGFKKSDSPLKTNLIHFCTNTPLK